jgi:hypothetical protein
MEKACIRTCNYTSAAISTVMAFTSFYKSFSLTNRIYLDRLRLWKPMALLFSSIIANFFLVINYFSKVIRMGKI